MRVFHRAVATAVAGLAFAAAGLVAASPASASPEDGKGCVGTPNVPDSYICVISATPANALPTITTTPVFVTVPKVCYFLDCTAAQTVAVPVPGATPGSGAIAVLWYKGQYIPIGTGTVDAMKLIWDTVNFGTGLANAVVGLTLQLANYALETGGAIAGQTVAEAQRIVDEWVYAVRDLVRQIREYDPTQDPTVQELLYRVRELYQEIQDCLRYYCISQG